MIGLNRTTYQYEAKPDPNEGLIQRTRELASRFPYYGSPKLYYLIRQAGMQVNHKRVERLYRLEKLSLRLKKSRKRLRGLRSALPVPNAQDRVWSMDFIHDRLVNGRQLKCLTLVDHCTREAPALHAHHSIRGKDVAQVLEQLRLQGRKPSTLVTDNGPEFRGLALARWAVLNQVRLHFIEPGKPIQNAFIESFNSRFRQECLNQNWFINLEESRLIIEAWRKEYETVRPHSGLKGLTPKMAAQQQSTQPFASNLMNLHVRSWPNQWGKFKGLAFPQY